MLVHIDSTAVHVFDVKIENKTETQLFKANGVFLNFAKESIRVYVSKFMYQKKIPIGLQQPYSPRMTF